MQQMRAIRCLAFGQHAQLELQSVPRPDITPGCVRVQTAYCGIGFPEMLMLKGKYQATFRLPFIPGSEIAGVVTEVGDGVNGLDVGARVVGLDQTFTGGLAEEIVTHAEHLVELPDYVPMRVAAGMAMNYATACYGLVQRAELEPGETALVLGAGGNLGRAFLEMILALGGRPLAACGSRRKLDVALSHGAEAGFDYSNESIREAVALLTDGKGLDLVVDPVGGDYSQAALRCLRPRGRLIVAGFAGGEIPCIPLNLPLLKNCSIVGVLLSTQVRTAPVEFRENLAATFELYRDGLLKPDLIEVDCFTDFSCGFGLLHERDRIGKVVMRISGVE